MKKKIMISALLVLLALCGPVEASQDEDEGASAFNSTSLEQVLQISIEGTFKEWCPIEGGLEIHCYITSNTCANVLWDTENNQYLIMDDSGEILGGGSAYKVTNTGGYIDPDTGLEAEVWRIDLKDPWY